MNRFLLVVLYGVLLTACSGQLPPPMDPSPGHIRPDAVPPAAAAPIPAPVTIQPILPAPRPAPRMETYTVVVSEVPAKELLFALARDANMNVDIHPDITGSVTLNAIDQTMPQILERLSRHIDLRYEIEDNNLVISPDLPYLRTYTIDYVNLERKSTSDVGLSSDISSGGDGGGASGGRSGSSTDVSNTSDHLFWETLTKSVTAMLNLEGAGAESDVIPNPEVGLLVVRATSQQHEVIQEYIDQVLVSARRQVLIEVTIVEVDLSDEFQGGVDWARINTLGQGLTLLSGVSSVAAGASGAPKAALTSAAFGAATSDPFFVIDYQDKDIRTNGMSLTVSLLKEFGDTRVLSSPKLMAMNNQTAVLKVVNNVVYFEITVEIAQGNDGDSDIPTVEADPKTVPVGIIMHMTPQISDNDTVILHVRPTISRIDEMVQDPTIVVSETGNAVQTSNTVPQIVTREMDSILKLNSGQIAVLGGLMQDTEQRDSSGLPYLSDVEGIGELFKHRDNLLSKSELVIFLRPVVIREPSIDKDLRDFRPFLQKSTQKVTKKTQPEQPR